MTEDGTITADEQRKALEYLLSPAQQREPPRLERIFTISPNEKSPSRTASARLEAGIGDHSLLALDRSQKYDPR